MSEQPKKFLRCGACGQAHPEGERPLICENLLMMASGIGELLDEINDGNLMPGQTRMLEICDEILSADDEFKKDLEPQDEPSD